MSDQNNGFDSRLIIKSSSPRVFHLKSEKKIKLEEQVALDSQNQLVEQFKQQENIKKIETMDEPENKGKSSNSTNSKNSDLLENSLNASSLWASTENSFVQVTEKLLHRGIQTDYLNTNTNVNNNNNNNNGNNTLASINNKTPTTVLMLTHPNIPRVSTAFEVVVKHSKQP
jgi:hypothetical protein